ncbi:hypothetical protein [Candidatus Methylacidiphilum infernorum]|nr:hypothetical protein [Candidatus Methylacidiphilum infernorum]
MPDKLYLTDEERASILAALEEWHKTPDCVLDSFYNELIAKL